LTPINSVKDLAE
jgi:hypothetical protein